MKKLSLISVGLFALISTSSMANTGLEKAIDLQVKLANEEIAVIEGFKDCLKKSGEAKDIKACHASKKVAMKKLWSARAKK